MEPPQEPSATGVSLNVSCSRCITNVLDGTLIDQTSITNTLECQKEKKKNPTKTATLCSLRV